MLWCYSGTDALRSEIRGLIDTQREKSQDKRGNSAKAGTAKDGKRCQGLKERRKEREVWRK